MCESSVDTLIYEDPNYAVNSLKGMQMLLHQEKFCDIEIVGKKTRFLAHGVVMASYSDFFKEICNLPKNSDSRIEIEMHNIDDDTIKKIVEYCYTGRIETTYDNLMNILNASGILQISYLMDITKDLMKSLVDIHNCCRIAEIAKKYSMSDLEEFVKEFILFNFSEISTTDEFLEIDCSLLTDLLKNEDLNVTSEVEVYHCTKRWIKHDMQNRKQHLHTLFELIKLPLLPAEILLDEIQPLCKSNPCSELVLEAIQWHLLVNRRSNANSNRTKQRCPGSFLLAVGDWMPNAASDVLIYNPATKLWSNFANINTTLRNFSCGIVDDNLIIFGGFTDNPSIYHDKVECFNLKTNEKSTLPNMLNKRNRPCVAVINDVIYVAGGHDGTRILSSVERYDSKTRTWKFVEAMPTARNEATGVVFENEFYVIGGANINAGPMSNVEAFCPRTGKWRICEPMNIPRLCTTAVVLKSCIYVVGGKKDVAIASAERYDPKSKIWTLIANLSGPRFGVALNRIGNNLISLGGSDGAKTLSVLEEYDPSTNQWKQLPTAFTRGHTGALTISKSYLKRIKPNYVPN